MTAKAATLKSNLLAFDLATRTGFAREMQLWPGGMDYASGKFDLLPKKHGWPAQLMNWQGTMRDFLSGYPANTLTVVAEEPQFMRSRDAARVCYSLWYVLQHECKSFKHKLVKVSPSTLKKWATGDGRAEKPAMVAAAQKFQPGVTDHNEADAVLLLAYGRSLGL